MKNRIAYNKNSHEEFKNASMAFVYEVQQNAWKNALDMVNEAEAKWEEDCCEWKKYKDKRINYKNCKWRNEDIDEYSVEQFEFCPYCGKKIKVVE